uniref:Uncharacterized protein n=1 Tax=Mycena chlorophos TaxID=658473 RepID=A0ABQ0L1C9_MYCCL|nr:predicted protein [Mycena chlorophos]
MYFRSYSASPATETVAPNKYFELAPRSSLPTLMVLVKEEQRDAIDHGADALPPPYTPSDPVSTSTSSSLGSDTQYVYYTLRNPDGSLVIPSHGFDSSRHFLGRIALRAIPPPRTAAVVKRCISANESLLDTSTLLYGHQGAVSPIPADDQITLGLDARLDECGTMGRPLVIEGVAAPARWSDAIIGYFYYRLYTSTGEDVSRVAFKPNEPSLGRVAKDCRRVRKTSKVLSAVAHIEQNPALRYANLFTSLSATRPLDRDELVPWMSGTSEETAVVLVAEQGRGASGVADTLSRVLPMPVLDSYAANADTMARVMSSQMATQIRRMRTAHPEFGTDSGLPVDGTPIQRVAPGPAKATPTPLRRRIPIQIIEPDPPPELPPLINVVDPCTDPLQSGRVQALDSQRPGSKF